MAKQYAVGQAERQRVGGAVRKSANCKPRRIHRIAVEDLSERLIDQLHVGAVTSSYHIPRLISRGRSEQQQPSVIRQRLEQPNACFGIAASAMQQEHEWQRLPWLVTRGHIQQRI